MFNIFFGKKQKNTKFVPPNYILFNVDTFNTWFNDKNNNAVYAHSGIFLRLDKLSQSHIEDYLVKCYNLSIFDLNMHEDIVKFHDEIRKDWLKKTNQ